jgi:hypothetical protein
MTHVGCLGCRLRLTPAAAARTTCPRCGAALSALAPRDALGFSLVAAPDLEWRPCEVDALARAVANVTAGARLP